MADANECAFPEKPPPPCGNCTLCQLREARAALRAQYVAGLEACLAIADRIRLESGAPTHSTAGMVAAEIRELAEQAKKLNPP